MKQKQDFEKILHNAKLKNTNPRLAVLEALSEIKHPETAQEIHKRLKKVDLVTLYRTLTSFEEKQLVKRIDLHKEAIYYELNTDHHHHIVCIKCNEIEDFENSQIEKALVKIVKNSFKFKNVEKHSLELFGVCNTCT